VVQRVAVCCSVLQCVAACCSVLQRVAVFCSVLQCVAVCCSTLQCVAVCYSALQCVAACCRALQSAAVRCSAPHCHKLTRAATPTPTGQTQDAATTNILNNLLASASQSIERSHHPNAPLGSAAADDSTPRGADILPPVLQQMLSPQPSAAWSAASRGQPRNTMPLPFAPTLPYAHKPAHGAHGTWQHERAAQHTARASEASQSTGKGGMLVAKWHARGTSEGGEVSEALLRDLFAAYGVLLVWCACSCVCMCIGICVYVCIYMCVYMCMSMCVGMFVCM